VIMQLLNPSSYMHDHGGGCVRDIAPAPLSLS
jgi:hypothetical protein